MRYSIIGGKGTGNLETAYAKASPMCRDDTKSLSDVKATLKEIYPDDGEFGSAFTTKRLSEPPIIRLVISQLETRISSGKEKTADPEMLTVEHVLPRSPGAAWPPELCDPARHGEIINRIGNLSLLTGDVNSSLPDDFQKKRAVYRGSELQITRSLADYESWNENSIEERQKEFAEYAIQVWQM